MPLSSDANVPRAESPQQLRERARQGSDRVVRECLGLQAGDTLALFYDETTTDCAELLIEAAQANALRVVARYVTYAEQIENASRERLPVEDAEALASARAVLLCFAGRPEATPYRKRLVKVGVDDRRLGTMPGATLEVLAHAVNVNYDDAWKRCGDLALAMLIADRAVLTSYLFDEQGGVIGEHSLEMTLGNFRRSPITSPGIIIDGTWGNLPGGETFIAPLEHTATGTFVLNGAFTGCVLPPHAPILLHFEAGELCGMEGEGGSIALLRELLASGYTNGHRLGLAELGVGVNPGVGELKGNALFDEKKEGTAHIAVGDNREYDGQLTSNLHEDFITCSPSLSFDGKPILSRGEWALRQTDWREDRAQAVELGRALPESFIVQRYGYEAAENRAGLLTVRRPVGANRVCLYTVADDGLSRDLAWAFRLLPDDFIRFDLFREKCENLCGPLDAGYLRGLVAVLQRHQLAAIEQPPEWEI
jgi:leucyl aminopeptidase (aminopeptidase T)